MKKILVVLLSGLLVQLYGQSPGDTLKYNLEQVTVTATRSSEKIISVPYSVSNVPQEVLENLRGYGLDEAVQNIPGVLAQSRSGNQDARIVIRGYGARGAGDRSNSGTSRGIKILINGFSETEPDGRTSFDMVDMSTATNVEVVRSNSSALWGNAAGGVINISTVDNFQSPFVAFQQQVGSFGYLKSVFNTGAFLDDARINLSLSNTNFDGWREHSSSSRFLANLNIITSLGSNSDLGVYLSGTSNIFHIPGPLTLEQFNNDPQQANPAYLSRDERRNNRVGKIGVTLDHRVNDNNELSGNIFINPKYLQRSERGTFRDFTRYHAGGNLMYKNSFNFSENVQNSIIAGLDEAYQDGAILFYTLSETNSRGDTLRDNKREGANTFGVFLHDEIYFEDNFRLFLGARYDIITYYSESYINPVLGLQERSFDKVTPKAGLVYSISPVHSVYFSMGGGVEVPAGNETDPSPEDGLDTLYLINPLLDPISSQTYELGTKQILFMGEQSFLQGLSYDIALYFITIKNDIIPYRGGRFYFTAGNTSRKGIEAGLNLSLSPGITLNGAVTYSSNEYDDYKIDSVHYGKPGVIGDFSGNKAAGIPDMFFNAGIKYSPTFFPQCFAGISVNHVGEYFADDANKTEVPSYTILNASLGMNDIHLSGSFYIRAFVNFYNLTDEKYAASAFINPDVNSSGQPIYLEPGMPRNVTASVQLSFR